MKIVLLAILPIILASCAVEPTPPFVAPGVPLPVNQAEAVASLKQHGYKVVSSDTTGIVATKKGRAYLSASGDSPLSAAIQNSSVSPESKMAPTESRYELGYTNGIYNGNFDSSVKGTFAKQ
jgi:hypothetical protein